MPHVRRDQTTQQLRDDLTGKPKAKIRRFALKDKQGKVIHEAVMRDVESRTAGGYSDKERASWVGKSGEGLMSNIRPATAQKPSTSQLTRFKRKAGATDVAGTAKRKPTTRGRGRKTVVKGDPVKARGQASAIKRGQAARTARARRKSSM